MTVQGTIYQLSSTVSSLTDLEDLPEVRTPEPFVARKKRMLHAQMVYGDSRFQVSARLVSPWDFWFQASSGEESQDAHERNDVDILTLLAEVRRGTDDGEEGVGKGELPPPPFMGVGYDEETGTDGVEVVSGLEVNSEEMAVTIGEGVWRGGAEVGVNFPVDCASRGGRMSEELVLRSLTALMGWS